MVTKKETVEEVVIASCGCQMTLKHYIVSGWQDDTAKEHLKNKFNIDIDERIEDIFSDRKRMEKICDKLTVNRLCALHFHNFISNVKNKVINYYGKNGSN